MVVPSEEPSQDNTADRFPLLMEPQESNETLNHIIDVQAGCDGSSSSSSHYNTSSCGAHHEDIPSSSVHLPASQSHASSLDGLNSRSSSITQRREGESGRRQWSPFNTILWLSIELVFTVGQITAAIVVLSVSRHEKPKTPLFAWVVGYAVGCAASLPILYWRYLHRYQRTEPGPAQLGRGDSSPGNSLMVDPNAYITISVARASEEGNNQNTSSGAWNGQTLVASNARLSAFMDHLKMALDCFFAVWFVVGNVWIFGGHSSSSVAPNLYRLCIVFLTFSCIGYAMPFILCSMICCCLPCIISILGIRDDMNRMRGASEETINALPTLKFKSKEKETLNNSDSNSGADAGGLVAAGTEKERVISGEDAVCCICLARYADNDELRELPCSHFFHTECVDKWLKINATCPLCKTEIGASDAISPSVEDPTQQV